MNAQRIKNLRGTVCITYSDYDDDNKVQIIYDKNLDREVEFTFECFKTTSDVDNAAQIGKYEDDHGNEGEDREGTSSMEWLPEPRNIYENICFNNILSNSEQATLDDHLQEIYDEFNRDFEQSCQEFEIDNSVDLTMGNFNRKPN